MYFIYNITSYPVVFNLNAFTELDLFVAVPVN
jgi:hypothetical protein